VKHAAAIRAFDYGAAICFGAVAAGASWLLVPDTLPGILAMLVGMGVGVAAAVPLLGIFSALLGGFEIVVMSMQIGMVAGMLGAMTGAGDLVVVAGEGAIVGLAIQLILHVLDRYLSGEVQLPRPMVIE